MRQRLRGLPRAHHRTDQSRNRRAGRVDVVHDGYPLLDRDRQALAGRRAGADSAGPARRRDLPGQRQVRQSFINAGIPIRHKTTKGINHWRMILYAGQAKVHFSAANFANGSSSPSWLVHRLRGRGNLFHRRPGGCAHVHDEVQQSLDQHPRTTRISPTSARGDETLSDLPDRIPSSISRRIRTTRTGWCPRCNWKRRASMS